LVPLFSFSFVFFVPGELRHEKKDTRIILVIHPIWALHAILRRLFGGGRKAITRKRFPAIDHASVFQQAS
jgi:hypothetical protein